MSNTTHFRNAVAAADTSDYVRTMVRDDGVRSNLCGQGVRTTLAALGIPHLTVDQTGAQDGHRWDEFLSDPRMREAGWEEVDWDAMGWSPENSPPGVVWVYGHNEPRPDPAVDKTGKAWGHVEIALQDGYVAGGFANNPGGSVRHNTPRAFVHPKLTELFQAEGAVPEDFARESIDRATEVAVEERRRREGDEAARTYREALETDVEAVDLSNLDLIDLIRMVLNIINGAPIDAIIERARHNGSGPEPQDQNDGPDGASVDGDEPPAPPPTNEGDGQPPPDGVEVTDATVVAP